MLKDQPVIMFDKLTLKILALLPNSDPFASPPSNPGSGGGILIPNPLGTTSLEAIVSRIISYLLVLATPVVVIMILYAAWLFITSAGNPDKINQAKRTIIYVVIGYGVLVLSQGLFFIFKQFWYNY